MAFEQYTRCIQPSLYIPRTLALILIRAALLAPLTVVIALAEGKLLCWLIVAEIHLMTLDEDVNDAEHPGGTGLKCAMLHAEFEGSGNYDLLQVAQAGLGFAVAALLACVHLPFPADVFVAALLAILGLLALIIGAIIGNGHRPGSPADANPDIGTLHTNSDPNEGKGFGADVVYVQGTWVFDPLHQGWNEIHPIKYLHQDRVLERGLDRFPVRGWGRPNAARHHSAATTGIPGGTS